MAQLCSRNDGLKYAQLVLAIQFEQFGNDAPTYKRILAEMNEFGFPGEEIIHVDKKWQNNRIESDHAALKRLTDPGKGFQSLRTAKATLKGIEAVRMIKRGHFYDPPDGVTGEIRLLNEMFGIAA